MTKYSCGEPCNVSEFMSYETLDALVDAPSVAKSKPKVLKALFESMDEDGVCLLTQLELSKLCNVSERQCRRVIKALRENDVITTKKDGATRKSKIYFIYKADYDEFTQIKNRKPNKSPLKLNSFRDELFTSIQAHYHPSRCFLQKVTAKQAFNKACLGASKTYSSVNDKKKAVMRIYNDIISYIDYLKTTRAWNEDNGRYLLGLGNFLKSGMWMNKPPRYQEVTPEKARLREIFEG